MNSLALKDPVIRNAILEAGMKMLMEAAEARHAICGAGGVAILYEEKLYPLFAPFHGEWKLAFDPDKQWPGEAQRGINYLGYAAGKLAQSVRTKEPSTDYPITTFDYGESNDVGGYCKKFFVNCGGDFELHAVYSGMESVEDKESSVLSVSSMEDIAAILLVT